MAEYLVTITLLVPIEARNQTQAEVRAARVEDAVRLDLDKRATWAGDTDMSYELEKC